MLGSPGVHRKNENPKTILEQTLSPISPTIFLSCSEFPKLEIYHYSEFIPAGKDYSNGESRVVAEKAVVQKGS